MSMVGKSFEVGDFVWAKMKGYPYLPGQIIDPPALATPKAKKFHHYVLFYGYDNHAWIPDEFILLHSEKLVAKFATQKKKPALYKEAVDNEGKSNPKYSKLNENNEIKKENTSDYEKDESSFEKLASKSASPKLQKHESSIEKLNNKDVTFKSPDIPKNVKRKVPLKKDCQEDCQVKKIARKRIKRESCFEKLSSKDVTLKVSRKRPSSNHDEDEDAFSESLKVARCEDNKFKAYETLFANIPPNIGYTEDIAPSSQALLSRNNYVERPPTPTIDLSIKNEILKSKKIQPTSKKIGFLGLGKLGQGIVKNLLQSGHSVTIWNRTTDKCNPFKDFGAEVASTPADVIEACDITFGCISDSDAAKDLFYCNYGILKGLEVCKENKGYVEMTSMNPKTSQDIAEKVKSKKGRYLEAPLTGSRVKANDGTLFVLAAGDRSLYDECESCFKAIASESMFVGTVVGSASKYNIIHSMLVGCMYASLAESLALVRCSGMDGNKFLEILQRGIINNREIQEKGKLMLGKEYTSNTPLKHVQKDLKLALKLGSLELQPLQVTATVNEVYKRLKLRYGDHDVSAVYEGTKG